MCPVVTSTGRLTALEVFSREEDITGDECYEMDKEQTCPDIFHFENFKRLSLNQFVQNIENFEDCYSEVTSISLKLNRDDQVGLKLINKIFRHCPKLCCLSIKSQRFDFGAWHRLLEQIIPSVLHLLIDDKIEINNNKDWPFQLFQQCKQLEDLKLELNENSDFDVECFGNLPTSIVYMHISDLARSESTLDIERKSKMLEKATQHIIRGKGRNLQYLRIGNQDRVYLTPSLTNIAQMTKLRGLNLNVINCKKSYEDLPIPIDYKFIKDLNLETLTDVESESDYFDTNGTNQSFHDLTKAKYRTTLNRRRLQGYELDVRKFDLLVYNFKHIAILQFINCVFVDKDMDTIIDKITRMPSLREIVIEDNQMFDNNSEDTDCLSIGLQQIKKLIRSCRRLDSLSLKLHLSEEEKSYLRSINRSLNIVFE